MLSGEEVWCQLWSEPNAGSDIASLQTRAIRDDDGWVINGQKVWTSGAHYAHMGLIITRTDPDAPKHRGITCFIVDMSDPGIDVRPLRQMTGGVELQRGVPERRPGAGRRRVGDVNDGWRVALTVLMNERMSVAGNLNVGGARPIRSSTSRSAPAAIDRARRPAAPRRDLRPGEAAHPHRTPGDDEDREGHDPRPGRVDREARVGRPHDGHRGAPASTSSACPAPSPDDGAPDEGLWTQTHLFAPGIHLGGGTDEVMRNIIGERVLGLPKEPSTDKGVPFRELLVGTQR